MEYKDFKAVGALRDAGDPMFGNLKIDSLSDREKRLIGIVVAATRGCSDCTGKRINEALESGISEETIVDAVNLCAAVNSGFELVMAVEGFKKHAL